MASEILSNFHANFSNIDNINDANDVLNYVVDELVLKSCCFKVWAFSN